MDPFKKILAMVFAALFVMTAVPALIFFNFDRRAFSAETYQKAFANADFYNQLPVVMADAMLDTTTTQGQLPVVMRGMGQEAWEAFFRTLLPQETLKSMGDEVLNATFAYINQQSDSVQFSLLPLKASMVSDSGVQAVYELLNTQAECSLEQVFQMTVDLLTKGEMQFCKPPAELYPMLTPAIQGQMQIATLAIPDQFVLIAAPPADDPRGKLQTARLLMRLSPLLPIGFLVMLTLASVTSLRSWLRWWGIPLAVTGLLASLASLSGLLIFSTVFRGMLIRGMPAYLPDILLEYAGDLASAMLKALLNPVLWQGLLLAFLGFGMTGISYLVKGGENATG